MSTVQQELIRGSLWSFRDQSCFSGVDPCCLFMLSYLILTMLSHYSTDQQVAVTGQYMLEMPTKAREKDLTLVNKNVNNAGFIERTLFAEVL